MITEYLSSLLNEEFKYGTNDCHVVAFNVIDIILSTEYHLELVGKYKTAIGGFKHLAKKGTFKNIHDICEQLGELQEYPNDGDILVHPTENHCSVYWKGKLLVVNELTKTYELQKYSHDMEYQIYKIRK